MQSLLRISKLIFLLALLALTAPSASAFYDPTLGRWINRDPIGEWSLRGDPAKHAGVSVPRQNLELYTFVKNSPQQSVDPLGLDLIDVIGGVIGGPAGPAGGVGAAAALRCGQIARRNYNEMKALAAQHSGHGGLVNLDKYYHCLTSCEMSKVCGSTAATILGNMKEWTSHDEDDSREDQRANAAGRGCACQTDCHTCCEANGYQKWSD